MLCSIIITNYNKRAYLPAAVESALSQTFAKRTDGSWAGKNLEVIVVDDGSTDGSLEAVAPYRDRVRVIPKDNGFQASAMNVGFAACRGDVVFFLDSDDMLLPDTVERVAAAWEGGLAKIHFRLQQITADGTPIPGAILPPYRPLPSGELTPTLRRFGFYSSPPTTGNAFGRRFLERVMPIPEEVYRNDPTTPLIAAAPLFGEIGALDGIGGYWRRNEGNVSVVGVDGLRQTLRSDLETMRFISGLAEAGPLHYRFQARWPKHLKERLIFQKFGSEPLRPAGAPVAVTALAYLGAVLRWPEYDMIDRMKFVAWAAAILLLPQRVLASVPGIAGASIRLNPPSRPA